LISRRKIVSCVQEGFTRDEIALARTTLFVLRLLLLLLRAELRVSIMNYGAHSEAFFIGAIINRDRNVPAISKVASPGNAKRESQNRDFDSE